MAKKQVEDFKRVHSDRYYKIAGRFVRQLEKEVTKLLQNHHDLSVDDAWDIVISAIRQADRVVSGGYGGS